MRRFRETGDDFHLSAAARAALADSGLASCAAAVAFAVNSITQDGETTWFEGLSPVVV
jgi:hypothetical protein